MEKFDQQARWTVRFSSDTNEALRARFGAGGLREDDVSAFIEEAVRWRLLDQTVRDAKQAHADLAADEIEAAIEEASAVVRGEMWPPASRG